MDVDQTLVALMRALSDSEWQETGQLTRQLRAQKGAVIAAAISAPSGHVLMAYNVFHGCRRDAVSRRSFVSGLMGDHAPCPGCGAVVKNRNDYRYLLVLKRGRIDGSE